MNFGPLEFAAYLRQTDQTDESPTVRAARAACPAPSAPVNLLTVVTAVPGQGCSGLPADTVVKEQGGS